MKRTLFCLLLLAGMVAKAQVFNNEWVDFGKTYYKFKVGTTGLYRIPQATLAAAGLGSVAAQDFQLWRNGSEVPIYTSVSSGTFSAADYIEFWGVMNDGLPDKLLYRKANFQLNDKWSLQTDTATYFLTVNPGGQNRRLVTTINNVSGNTLPAEPYFMHTVGNYFKNQINGGYAVNVGEYMFSSAYDRGEGWSSPNIGSNGSNSFTFSALFPFAAGPSAKFKIAVSGNATNQRRFRVTLNGDSLLTRDVNFLNERLDSTVFPVSRMASGSAAVVVTNITAAGNDRMVIHKYEITYPRQFNFGGASNFEFSLPPSPGGNYLQISNFNYGSTPPVLYDLTNGRRYIADISTAGQVRVVLEPSSADRNLVLVRQELSNVTLVQSLLSRTFTNYSLSANQGDYIIITNPLLFNGPNGTNPVEEYKAYRSSAAGGSYNARIYLIEDLVDQFGFGIKMHPLAIQNFLRYARQRFTVAPRQVFLIGKAVNYVAHRRFESNPAMDRLNLVPTFGNPASDVMLSADPGKSNPMISIGRLSAITAEEVKIYLEKVKEFELAQRTPSPLMADKIWMKNVVHAVGATEPGLLATIDNYMNSYKRIISDTLFGGRVTTFTKSSPNSIEQVNSGDLDRLFSEGITLLTYFGHSSSGHLEFNLNSPDQYNNQGKYPMFIALGCNAGNNYNFNGARFLKKETLSENFVLAPNRGSIGFIASSHFGITDYLHVYNQRIYDILNRKEYGKSIGEILKSSVDAVFAFTTQEDFYARATCEETSLNGDPAVVLNPHPKPDYVIEDPLVKISPGFVSVADFSFKVKARFHNIGKAIGRPIVVQVKRESPNGTSQVIYRDSIQGIRYADSIEINVPIDPLRDKGTNRITVSIDADNSVEELFENNNVVTKEVVVFEDEARPAYPYNFSIVNKQNIKFVVSTADPFSPMREYRLEIDTTELFNSTAKVSASKSSPGGVIEFAPNITFRDSVVYYWRVASVPASGQPSWASAFSFTYISGSEPGFSQSHYFQHQKSAYQGLSLDTSSRSFSYKSIVNEIYIRNGVLLTATGQEGDVVVNVNGASYIRNTCKWRTLAFNVFDGKSFKPWENVNNGGRGLYGSNPYCGNRTRINSFEFDNDTSGRRKALEFLRQIPSGNYIVFRMILFDEPATTQFAPTWAKDELIYGQGNSLYSELKRNGFSVDSFYKPRAFAFVYRKNVPEFTPKEAFSVNQYDVMTMTAICPSSDSLGYLTSPVFGPAKAWKSLKWKGGSFEIPSTDSVFLNIVGYKTNGGADTLIRGLGIGQQDVDISNIDARLYPYVQLRMRTSDGKNFTPFQLKYWNLSYVPKPEGAIAPNLHFSMKDTLDEGEPVNFALAFKNISDANFDSLKVKAVITDKNNVAQPVTLSRQKPLLAGDTLQLRFTVESRNLSGANSLFVEVNPDNDQPELYRFNNFLYKNFYVKGDTLSPTVDVTFDNQHILNGDIVAAKPFISIKLKDNAKWLLLDDTSLVNVQVRHPNGNYQSFRFDKDTLQFFGAQPSSGDGNVATVNFKPHFSEDGTYELIVKARDKSNNLAGNMEYRVSFQVINKPMISNLLNYPNPFTSSTAFVFTITGSEVPQNIKIQILSITGRVVREITKEELGTLRIGRNITEYKWDGKDQYGEKLANGVYLYRVITNLNGKALDRYKGTGDKTDQYFNNGYGKMYLMR